MTAAPATLALPGLRERIARLASSGQLTAGLALVIRLAGAAVTFLSQIVLARWMGDTEFGVYVGVWTWLLILSDAVHLGLPLVAQRFVPQYAHSGDDMALRGFLVGSRWTTFALATLSALAAAGALALFGGSAAGPALMPTYLALTALPFFALSLMCDGLARAHSWIALALAPPQLLRPLILFAVLAAVSALGCAIDATTVMAALAFAVWLSSLVQLVLLQVRLTSVIPPGPRRYKFRTWYGTAFPVFLAWSFFVLLSYADVVVLQQFRPAEEVAHYYAAVKTLMLVGFIHFSVSAAVAHRFTALSVAGKTAELATYVAETVRWTFWPSLAATVVILVLGQPILGLFGPGFADAYSLMFILAATPLARAAIGPAERLLSMVGAQRLSALVYAATFGVNITLCLALAPQLGGIGAAIATSAAAILESALLAWVAERRLGVRLLVCSGRPARPT
ncbi:MAG: lipopolysaccharide biosynthesis protein [Bauldia sp.]